MAEAKRQAVAANRLLPAEAAKLATPGRASLLLGDSAVPFVAFPLPVHCLSSLKHCRWLA